MEDPLDGKVIVTTSSRIKLVTKLRDFMAMKSIMMQAKRDPQLLSDPSFLSRAMEYLKSNTEFTELPFWKNLTQQAKDKSAQYFVLQEVSHPVMVRMKSTKEHAAVFVVLSGSAEITNANGELQVLGPGALFGATDLFHEVLGDRMKYSDFGASDAIGENVVAAKMNGGSYLRIGLMDMLQNVFGDDGKEKVDKREYSRISEIPWEEMTEDDKFYVKVYLRTQSLVNKNLFSFLDSYRFVPKNARMTAFRFYQEKDRGKSISFTKKDALEVIIVVEGALTLEIEAKRKGSHKLSCTRKGRSPMTIKTSTMPLIQYQAGSLIFIRSECFELGKPVAIVEKETFVMPTIDENDGSGNQSGARKKSNQGKKTKRNTPSTSNTEENGLVEDPAAGLTPASKQHSSSNISASSRRGSECTLDSIASFHSFNNRVNADSTANAVAHRPKTGGNRKGKDNHNEEERYKLHLKFETESSVLRIPFEKIERILGDEKKVMRSMADNIRCQLQQANDTVHKRIQGLEDWIRGGKDLIPVLKNKSNQPKEEEENLLPTSILQPGLGESSSHPVGSFTRAILHDGDGQTSLESTNISVAYSMSVSDETRSRSAQSPSISSRAGLSSPGSTGERSPSRRPTNLKDMITFLRNENVDYMRSQSTSAKASNPSSRPLTGTSEYLCPEVLDIEHEVN